MSETIELEPVARMKRDIRAGAAGMSQSEARYLVDTYYQMQAERIAASNRVRAAAESGEPHNTLLWFQAQAEAIERQVKSALGVYAQAFPQGRWMLGQKGIGPVIAAGFLSRLELRPTVGHWWRFAGLDPTSKWEKGQKRPWNAALKRLCWLTGESFVKVSGRDDAFYGRMYRERKAYETAKNEAGEYASIAAEILASRNFRDDTTVKAVYEAGRLPPAHIHARAKRWAVKLFLSHLHHVWHEVERGSPPPKPYILTEEGGHAHYIAPPDWVVSC